MKRFCAAFILGFFFVSAFAVRPLSDQAQVSLLTCSPCNEAIYTKFGHTSIRVADSENNFDIVFNYGVFSFSQPRFIPRFIKGETDYELGISDTDFFLEIYRLRGSLVEEQVLNLTPEERERLWQALMENYEPENRYYRYNFVFDNCATRPYQMIESCCSSTVYWDIDSIETTYRTLFAEKLGYNTWSNFGVDILIGSLADKPIGLGKEKFFLPSYLKQSAQNAYIGEVEKRSLVKTNKRYPTMKGQESKLPFLVSPIGVCCFILLLVALLSFYEYKRNIHLKWIDSLLFFVAGFCGIIIFYLMFFSQHPLVAYNYNILWLNPLLIFLSVVIWWKPRRLLRIMHSFNLLFIVATFVLCATKTQVFHIAFLPLMTTLFLRSLLYMLEKKRV